MLSEVGEDEHFAASQKTRDQRVLIAGENVCCVAESTFILNFIIAP